MTTLKPIAAAALLAATAVACKESPAEVRTPVAAAQAAGAAQDTMQRRGRPFHRGMLRLPPQLELTAEQKAQLEQIRTELMQKNRPLMEQVRSITGAPEPGERGERARRGRRMPRLTEEQRAQVRPLFEQIRANHRAAREQMLGLLTPEQKETLEKLRAERVERWRERANRGRRGPRHDRGAQHWQQK